MGRPTAPATLMIRNARVYTVDAELPWADAVAVEGNRISWVGGDEGAAARTGPGTEVIDAGGSTVLPGFIDSHNHVRLGSNPLEVGLAGASTLDDVKGRIRAHAEAHPEHAWIEGVGFNYSVMPGGRLPTWRDLEGLTGGRPAFVLTYDAHNAWLNREAMELLGIDRRGTTLAWGHARIDQGNGEPTGIVGDFAVMGISRLGQRALEAFLPGYEPGLQYERTLESLDMATAFGITTVVEPQNSPDDMWIFERARDEGRLRSRLVAASSIRSVRATLIATSSDPCASDTTTIDCVSDPSSSTSTTWSSRGPPRCWSPTPTSRGSEATRSGGPRSSRSW